MRRPVRLVLPLLAWPATSLAAAGGHPGAGGEDADPWSRFRGPNGSGVAAVESLPERLDPGEDGNVLWRTPLPPGHSSPVLSTSRVFLTALDEGELATYALDRGTGEVLWRAIAPRPRVDALDGRNHPASPSPVVGSDLVVVFFPEFGLLAYDHDGEELWRRPLGPFRNVYGMGASPILAGDTVLLACDQNRGSYLLAAGARDGAERWRAERPWARSGHCTPILHAARDGTTEVLLPGSFSLDAYELATGARRWSAEGLCFEMKSVPVLAGGLVVTNGYGSPMNQPGSQIEVDPFEAVLAARDADGDGAVAREEMPATRAAAWFEFVDLDADGRLGAEDWAYLEAALASQNGLLAFALDAPEDAEPGAPHPLVWEYRRSVPQLPSPLVLDDVLWVLEDQGGLLSTFVPSTGELRAKGRIEDAQDAFYASPVGGAGRIYLASEHGTLCVLPSGGSLEPLSVTRVEGKVYATPALAEGRVFLRTDTALWCFGAEEEAE